MDTPVICIDGPGGSGKGTIARLVAEQLGWHFLDSGSLYRVLALAALNHGVELTNEQALKVMAEHLDVDFKTDAGGDVKIILEGEDVTKQLRLEETGNAASKVAVLPDVRDALLSRQRAFARAPGLVADGRDMGTIVFPNAPVKIFLTASVEIRAERRHKQLKQQGKSVSIATLSKAIQERDDRDINREIAPLVPADDAVELDTTSLDITQVLEKVMEIAKKAVPELAPIKQKA